MKSRISKLAGVAALTSILAACGSSGDSSVSTVASPEPGTTETSITVATTIPADSAPLCKGYLVLLRSGDADPLRAVVEDEAVMSDIETMLASEGEFEAISAAALRVEDYVVSRCVERFTAGLTPAQDDSEALGRFMTALADGQRAEAEKVAWAHVVAQFPWSPESGMSFEVDGATATAELGRGVSLTCRAQRGAVVSCRFGPG